MIKYICIISTCIINIVHLQDLQYLIYTNSELLEAANNLSQLHSNDVDDEFKLNTKIILIDTLQIPINHLILNEINNNNGLQYLTILGDESIIPPYYYLSTPSDDYYSSNNLIGIPQPNLKTGRITANSLDEAQNIVEKIRTYIMNPTEGIWKNKMLLLCDNEYKSGSTIREEKMHTVYSDSIYNNFHDLMPVKNLYGTDFELQESSDWFTQPQLTDELINTINSGVGIINYIGHGTHEILADEDILKMDRDLDLINTENKLPIWIVGTCSFGSYDINNTMAEQLLKKDNAAIAVITTSRGIYSTANFNYLNNLLNTQLKNYILNLNNHNRIGDIFFAAKEASSQAYRYHLFGDPAIPINIAKINYNIINENIDTLYIGNSNNITSNFSNNTINVFDQQIDKIKYYTYTPTQDNECNNNPDNCIDSLKYSIFGSKLFESTFNNNIDFYIPLDVSTGNKAQIFTYNEDGLNNQIDIINNINLSLNINENLLNDNLGPNIKIAFNNTDLNNFSNIYPPYNFDITIEDNNPINLSGLNFHNIRIWIDDNSNSFVLNNYFQPTSDTSGTINFSINEEVFTQSQHRIYLEAWDILNNHTIISFDINNIEEPSEIYNVYNIPNPFTDKTFFTFNTKNPESITIKIDVFSKKGILIKSFNEYNYEEKTYHFFPENGWDGTDNNNNKIPNGTYLYRLKVIDEDNIIHNQIHHITKAK